MAFTIQKAWVLVLLSGLLVAGLACSKAPDDAQLTSQIQSKMNEDSGLQGKGINVQTAAGVVTLSGTVDNDAQRTAAARYASDIAGVKQVVNNLQMAAPAAASAPVEAASARAVPERPAVKPRAGTPARVTQRASDEAVQKPAAAVEPPRPEPTPAMAQNPPAPTPPPPPPPKKVTVASGTAVAVRLVEGLDSETAQPGQTFRATLDSPLPTDGDAVPSGYDVKGHVVDVKSAGKFAGQSLLVLQLDSITVGGRSYSVQTDPYRRQGSNRTTNTAEKVGAGAVIGAIIGGIAGGGKGAGIGAAAGGGLGGGVQAATKGQQIKLPSETVINFRLADSVTVTLPDQGPNSGRRKLDTPQ